MKGRNKYPVGYGRPPVHSRWKQGQSGNPKGRPKGSGRRQMAKAMQKVLGERMEIVIAGEVRLITQRELVARGMVKAAIKGSPSAYRAVMDTLPPETIESSGGVTILLSHDDMQL